MALIICTECGKEFSDKAEACPNCGSPTEYLKREFQKEQIQTTEDNESKQETAAECVSDENVTNTEPEEAGFVLVSEDEYQSGLNKKSPDEVNESTFAEIPYCNDEDGFDNTFDEPKTVLINKKDGIVKHFGEIVKQRPQMNRSTKNVPIDKKKVGIIVIAIIVIISGIIGIQCAFQDRINWNDIVLGDIIPEPASNRGYIWENSKRQLDMDVYNITTNEYYAYISDCSEKSFIIDPESGEFEYSAYNKEGYKLEVTYSDYSEEMSIDLEEPMKLGSIDWNFDGLGQYIPELDSNVGVILNDDEKEFSLYVGNIDKIKFENYVKKCNEEGFNVSSVTTDESYEAKNKDGYRIKVEYVGFNIVEITILEPVYAVSIRVECVENLALNKYDVDVSIEGQESLGTITHGSTETFQVELPKGTHTLYCKNDWLDEDYEDTEAEGETKFEVTGKINIAFEIYCKTDRIAVTVISDEQASEEEEEQTESESTTEVKSEDKILTIENCSELKAMLETKGEFDGSYSDFAENYEGKTIKFNGKIDAMNNHENYDTRYDILLTYGNSGSSGITGPYFQFEDVGPYDLGLSFIDNVAAEFSVGDNVVIKAEVVSFDENSGLMKLDPISLKLR